MQEILKKLYYMELEEQENLSQNNDEKTDENKSSAYENLLNALSDTQKALFFAYEAEHNAAHCEYETSLYRSAFSSGFRLAQELLQEE